MSKIDISIAFLTAICLCGIILLTVLNKDISFLLPITTTFVGWLIGKKQDEIVSLFKKNK